jgi:phospholipid-transporting ATPase
MVVNQEKLPLNGSNLLLRGCSLRNTEFILGAVVYTGHQTKIMLNSVSARPKRSHLDHITNYFVLLLFVVLLVVCFLLALTYSLWEYNNGPLAARYITDVDYSFIYNFVTRFGNWILMLGNLIPISLIIALEMTKFAQGFLMEVDQGMIARNNHNIPLKVNSSNLNEELGQIQYIFSDKTGTLTCNEMRFKYLMIGGTVYGEKTGYTGKMPQVSNVDFSDPTLFKALEEAKTNPESKRLVRCLNLLALCHTIVMEKPGEYNASSPDELAFANFAKMSGVEFMGMDEENFMQVNELGARKKYKLLDTFEFNSDKKRMSVIVQDETGTATLFVKGADNIMEPRYSATGRQGLDQLKVNLERFAGEGYRTLLLGYKDMTPQEYQAFKTEYDVRDQSDCRPPRTTLRTERKPWHRSKTS